MRGSEYLVWLVFRQWIKSPSVDKSVIWFGFNYIFSKIFERSVDFLNVIALEYIFEICY